VTEQWTALKELLEKIGRGQTVFAGHILMVMDELEKNPAWDLQKDGFSNVKPA
jgi:hypothetical protein